jgi:hypothetical protein
MKLNGWYRLGIVASVAWALIGGWHEMGVLTSDESTGWRVAYNNCANANAGLPSAAIPSPWQEGAREGKEHSAGEDCARRADEVSNIPIGDFYRTVALTAFVPVALGWIVALLAVFTFRWVWRGFRPKPA